MISVDALIFDLDGTLIDSKQDIAASVQYIQHHYGRPPSHEADIASFIGNGVANLLERALGPVDKTTLDEAIPLFKKHYREHCVDHTYIYPGVTETLTHFRSKKMAVVTNKPVRISQHILDRLGLSEFFPVVLGGDSTARKKPHPDPVLQALETLGIRSVLSALMIGDGQQDILAGRAAGVRTCGIFSNIGDQKALGQSGPDFTILKIDELMRIIN